MKNKLALLIEILPWLTMNPGVSAKECAQHFAISEKQLIDLLQLAVFTGPGQGGGELVDIDFEDAESIFVSDAKGLARPIKLTQTQAVQVIGGLHSLIQLSGVVQTQDLVNLLTKVQSALNIKSTPLEIVENEFSEEIAGTISEAIIENKAIEITYTSATTGNQSTRIVEPKSIVVSDNRKYLNAWCHAAIAFRQFRIDLIQAIKLLDRTQVDRSVIEVSNKDSIQVKLSVTKSAALEFDEKIVSASVNLDDDRVQLTVAVHSLEWIAREILASHGQIRAIAPTQLVELVNEKVAKWREHNPVS